MESELLALREIEERASTQHTVVDIDPLEEFLILLGEPGNWIKVQGDRYIYHRFKSQFVIKEGKTVNEDFRESWTQQFPDPHSQSYEVEYWYDNTLLKSSMFVAVDGGRYSVPLPKVIRRDPAKHGWDRIEFSLSKSSLEWKTAMLFDQYDYLENVLAMTDIKLTR